MTISKIINWCIKHNYRFTAQDCINNNQRVVLAFTDYNIYSAVYNTVKKLKNTYTESKAFFSGDFEGYIYLYNIDDYNDIKDYNNNKSKLHDIFNYAMHEGCSSEDAQKIQYQYAIDNNLIDIYDKIYA
jgi:hypothetical protein